MCDKYVRIEFWQQDTMESGRWLVTDPMNIKIAEELIAQGVYESPTIKDEATLNNAMPN
jgi:hypothetical protein